MSQALENANKIHQRARKIAEPELYCEASHDELRQLVCDLAKSHASVVARLEILEARQSRQLPRKDPDGAD